MGRGPYPSDLSDEHWVLIEPMITAWKQARVARSATGVPGACDLREVVNAIFYQNRTGCQWRYLPHDLPAWSAVFHYFTESSLARHPRTGRVNVIELLADLQAQHDKAAARADEPRDQIQHLTAALTETEARLANLVTTRKVIAELAPASGQPAPPETNTAYQAIVNTFNQRPDQEFRARELHELLGMPTDEASVDITRSRLGRLTRQGFLTQPGRGRYQKRT